MKKILVIAALIVAMAAALPFASGLVMERTARRAVEELNSVYAYAPDTYSLEIVRYDRGYLTTDVEWKIHTGALAKIYGVESVRFKEHARHGFFGVVSTTSLEENAWFSSFVDKTLQGKNPLHIRTVYRLFGGMESTVIVDAFSVMVEGEGLDVRRGEATIKIGRTYRTSEVSGKWQGIAMGEEISLGEVSVASNMEKVSALIWEGDTVLAVENLRAVDEDAEFELADMKVRQRLDADKDANIMDFDMLFSVGSLRAKSGKIDDASVRFAVRGMKLDAVEEFVKAFQRMSSEIMAEGGLGDENGEKDEEMLKRKMARIELQMMGAYEKMLKEGLEIRISDLRFRLSDEEVKGGITLRLLKDMTFIQFAPIASRPQLLFDILYVKSDLSLPIRIVGENPRMLNPLYPGMQTGLFIKEGDRLVHGMETRDGKLYLNGREVLLGGPTHSGRIMN